MISFSVANIDIDSQDRSVSEVTDYGSDTWCSITGKGRDFSVYYRLQTGSGSHSDSCPMSRLTGAISPGIMRQGREATL
jgi:hypothetical protein